MDNFSTPIFQILIVLSLVFFIGVFGVVFNRTSILAVLVSLEVSLLAVSLNFLIASIFLDDIAGQVFSLFIIAIAACESSVGLAIILSYYRVKGSIRIDEASLLKS